MFLSMREVAGLRKKISHGENLPEDFPFLHAISEDKQRLVVIRKCRIDREASGKLSHFFPDSEGTGDNQIACMIIDSNGMAFGYPIPDSFEVKSAAFENGALRLESRDGKTVIFESFLPFPYEPTSLSELESKFYQGNYFQCDNSSQSTKRDKSRKSYISVLGVGRLLFNSAANQFEIRKNGIDFVVDDLPQEDMKKAKKNLQHAYEDLSATVTMAKSYAAKALLATKNESWLQDNESPLTEKEFSDQMQLESVEVDDEEICLVFKDNDLFWGHYIEVRMTSDSRLISAGIVG